MNSAAIGITYTLWLRMRWSLTGILLYLSALAIAAHTFPGAGEPVMLAALLVTAAIAHLLQVFILGPADIGVSASGFPKNMFVLPVATRALVGWPMLCGAAVHAGLWVLVATLVLIPAGFAAPIVWPAVIVAAGTAWVQAIGWSPFPTPYARIPALSLAITPLVLLAAGASVRVESDTMTAVVIAGSGAWMAIAYAFAVRGVSRARSGSDGGSIVLERIAEMFARRRNSIGLNSRSPFRTAARAQLWHEWRRNASFLPAMMGVLAILLLVLSCSAMINPTSDRTLMFGSFNIPPAAMSLLASVGVLLMFSATLGQSVGKFDIWGKEEVSSFFAIRPLTTNQYVLLKFTAAAMSALASCAILLVFVALWALVEASPLNARESLVRPLLSDLSPRQAAIAISAFVGLVVVTWRSIATGLWLGLIGRKWVSVVMAAIFTALMTLAVIFGSWVYRTSEVQAQLLWLLPWLVGAFVGLKMIAAASTSYALWSVRLASGRTLGLIWGVWLTAAVVALATTLYFVPFSWLLIASAILFVPFTRLAVAPLALHWNRHR